MSAVISTGGGNIADISLPKDTTRRHRNKIQSKRYVLLWDGKMLQNIEHVGTFKEVIAILLAATDKKSDVLLQINPVDQKYITVSEQTKIILDTLDKWKIERDLIMV